MTETQSFFLYVLLVIITAFFMMGGPDYAYMLGIIGIFFGLYGFLRLIYFLENRMDIPQALSLSTGLLFGLHQERMDQKEEILKRFERSDMFIWAGLGFLYLLWMILNSFVPLPLTSMKATSFTHQHDALGYMSYYALTNQILQFGLMAILFFVALTFSRTQRIMRWAIPLFATAIGIGFIGLSLVTMLASPLMLPDLSIPRGAGAGTAMILSQVASDQFGQSLTTLMIRFYEFGWVGAVFPYAILTAPLAAFLLGLCNPHFCKIPPLIGVIMLFFMGFVDCAVVVTGPSNAIMLLCLMVIGFCWGATRLNPKQEKY